MSNDLNHVVWVRPLHGLILDGIPATGAEIPEALADEWIADRLVERIEPPAVKEPPAPPKPTGQKPQAKRSTK